jgi:predicted HTH domain antitoxin
MHTLTTDDLSRHPERLLDDARKGQADIVMSGGEPLLLTVPLGADAGAPEALLELAVALYESDQISLGRAAEVAGLPYGRMVDELGRRGIPTVRYGVDELDRELEHVRTLAGGR